VTVDGDGVTLDLTEMSFIDSTGLHEIVRYAHSLNGQGPLVLANVPDRISMLLELVTYNDHPGIEVRRAE
jgi:anti-anti-sigma regulatory factor